MSHVPTMNEISAEIERAGRAAFTELFQQHQEHFYYVVLVTTGEAFCPFVSAWSIESLERAVENADDKEDAIWGIKWSYADSPYLDYGSQHFAAVKRMFSLRPSISSLTGELWQAEFDLRLEAMEMAMKKLDDNGIFGKGTVREHVYVNVEVVPPDYSNVIRARRLNPEKALEIWLREAAEPEEDGL